MTDLEKESKKKSEFPPERNENRDDKGINPNNNIKKQEGEKKIVTYTQTHTLTLTFAYLSSFPLFIHAW